MSRLDFTFVDLYNLPSYRCTAMVDDRTLKLEFTWVERLKKRYLTVRDASNRVYLQSSVLNINENLELNTNAKEDGFDYKILLCYKVKTPSVVVDYENWADEMILSVNRELES